MGLLLDLVTKREMLLQRYCDIREKKNQTREDKLLLSGLVARLYLLDEAIEEQKVNAK